MKWIIPLFIFLLALFIIPIAFAKEQAKSIVVPQSETINHDYFAAGNTVVIDGTINGDVYVAGGTILVDGNISGDVLLAGGDITIGGTVRNVRVIGGNTTLNGNVLGNVSVVGGNITLTNTARVQGNVVGAGGQVNLLGPIGRDIDFAGGNITIANTVGGGVNTAVGQLTLSPLAHISGPLTLYSASHGSVAQGATIGGKITHNYPPQKPTQNNSSKVTSNFFPAFARFFLIWKITGLILAFVIGMLLIQFTPEYTKKLTNIIRSKGWFSFGIGLLTFFISPVAIILFVITLIGIPFALLWIFSIAIFGYIGRIVVALIIGEWVVMKLNKKPVSQIWSLLIGLIIFGLLSFIPILGGLARFVITMIGLGATVIMEKNFYTELRAKKII